MTHEEYCQKWQQPYEDVKQLLLQSDNEKFVTDAEAMYDEFKREDGYVTCEFSTKDVNLGDKMKFLSFMSMKDKYSIGHWQVFWCSICEGHHPDAPFHCEIVRDNLN